MTDDEAAYWNGRMAEISGKMERILDRISGVEGEVRNLRSEHSVTRDLVTQLPATLRQRMMRRSDAAE
jgi:hypothetical protein